MDPLQSANRSFLSNTNRQQLPKDPITATDPGDTSTNSWSHRTGALVHASLVKHIGTVYAEAPIQSSQACLVFTAIPRVYKCHSFPKPALQSCSLPPMFTRDHPATGFTHLGDVLQRPRWLQRWESLRHGSLHWLIECIGEALGVYFYVYLGVGANAAYNIGALTKQAGVGSLQTVALGYGFGIVFAVAIAGSVSGGHFNPCVTIAQTVWRGFPWRKAPLFIVSQILGAYIACLVVYGQYRTTFKLLEEALVVAGEYDTVQFTPNGVAGIFGLYTLPNANLRDVFMNEFFADFFLALIIWGILDPTNFFVPPSAAPWTVGLAYAAIIWAYAPGALSANTARDLGGRLMALTIWGKSASGGRYAAIAALTNIPATMLATLFYELILVDSSRVLPRAQQEFLNGHKAHLDHKDLGSDRHQPTNSSNSSTEKGDFRAVERVA